MTTLILVITYLHLPIQIEQLEMWGGYGECKMVGEVIMADAKKNPLVTNASYMCTE